MNGEEGWKRAKIGLLYTFMYVAGPLLWGGWMVFRLRLLTPSEYVRCLLSPFTLGMLAVFLAGNLANVLRAAGAHARAGDVSIRRSLRAHCAALVIFGTVGTFLFLVPLSGRAPGARGLDETEWLARAGIGALSGASLVFLTYGFFTVVIFRLITGSADTLRSLRGFYSTLFPLGAVFFVAAAALAGLLQGLTVLAGVSLVLPLATTGFLFVKTMYRTDAARKGATHGVA
jgi:hypothetical protein